MQKLLLVEDDIFLREGMTDLFEKEGYYVAAAANKLQAEELLCRNTFDVIALDVLLPDGNGLDICRSLRGKNISVPVVFITACDDENEIVAGLDAGADDYVTKPFRSMELLARIRSLLRRNSKNVIVSGDITVDAENMSVLKNGCNIYVTPTEFQILLRLVRSNGAIVTRASLLANIWDNDGSYIDDNTLSVHVSRLREKVGAGRIATVRGIGYRWEAQV